MGSPGLPSSLLAFTVTTLSVFNGARCVDLYLEWNVTLNTNIDPFSNGQPVIAINGMFPGPLINATTNDNIRVNVFNNLDEPLLMTWNGIEQRLNSWQDGVSGTNCPIQPGANWTYEFQVKDQIGSFFYFPSTRFQKAGGGFGPVRVNNRVVIPLPFPKPDAEFDLLVGDWYGRSYKSSRANLWTDCPLYIFMNGKAPYGLTSPNIYESFNVTRGMTYRFRVSNVGTKFSINFRIENHRLDVVEAEGSYVNRMTLNSLDIHVGQSFSVLVTADQVVADYFIVASPTQTDIGGKVTLGLGVLHYDGSSSGPSFPIPGGPDPTDPSFSINQARSIRWNLTAGAARPNRQGAFNVTNATISQTFILHASMAEINGSMMYTVNNVSYLTPGTPLKLADQFKNGSGVYELDAYPEDSVKHTASHGTFVATGVHKAWVEIVFKNNLDDMDSWHLDGFGFFVVGFGDGDWSNASRSSYNLFDPVVRSTVQVYPGGWTAVYAYLDNPGMWNLRSQNLKNWYLGEELYIRVYDPDPNPAKERPPPQNLLLCGIFSPPAPPSPSPPPQSERSSSSYRYISLPTSREGARFLLLNIAVIIGVLF